MIRTARWSNRWYLLALAVVAACALASQRPAYHPDLRPIPGHRLWNATQPRGLVAGYIKTLQGPLEITPCAYTIRGWDTAGALYFEALCEGRLQLWTARPEAADSVRRIGQLPPDLAAQPLSKTVVYALVRAAGVVPASAEPSARRLHIHSQPYPSPDGAWLAFVTKHYYGPEDVLLLSAAP